MIEPQQNVKIVQIESSVSQIAQNLNETNQQMEEKQQNEKIDPCQNDNAVERAQEKQVKAEQKPQSELKPQSTSKQIKNEGGIELGQEIVVRIRTLPSESTQLLIKSSFFHEEVSVLDESTMIEEKGINGKNSSVIELIENQLRTLEAQLRNQPQTEQFQEFIKIFIQKQVIEKVISPFISENQTLKSVIKDLLQTSMAFEQKDMPFLGLKFPLMINLLQSLCNMGSDSDDKEHSYEGFLSSPYTSQALSLYYEILNSMLKYLSFSHKNKSFKHDNNCLVAKISIERVLDSDLLFYINSFITKASIQFWILYVTHWKASQLLLHDGTTKEGISLGESKESLVIRPSKIIKILNSLLCIDQKLIKAKDVVKVFLVLSVSSLDRLNERKNTPQKFQSENLSLFFELLYKTEYNLCRKLQKFQYSHFDREDLLNLLKLSILCEVNSSEFLQSVLSSDYEENQENDPQSSKFEQQKFQKNLENIETFPSIRDQVQKSEVSKVGYSLLCFAIQNLINNNYFSVENKKGSHQDQMYWLSSSTKPIKSECECGEKLQAFKYRALVIGVKYLKNRYSNHLTLYHILLKGVISERDEICEMYLNFIRLQSIESFSVQKLKALFKTLVDLSKQAQCLSNSSLFKQKTKTVFNTILSEDEKNLKKFSLTEEEIQEMQRNVQLKEVKKKILKKKIKGIIDILKELSLVTKRKQKRRRIGDTVRNQVEVQFINNGREQRKDHRQPQHIMKVVNLLKKVHSVYLKVNLKQQKGGHCKSQSLMRSHWNQNPYTYRIFSFKKKGNKMDDQYTVFISLTKKNQRDSFVIDYFDYKADFVTQYLVGFKVVKNDKFNSPLIERKFEIKEQLSFLDFYLSVSLKRGHVSRDKRKTTLLSFSLQGVCEQVELPDSESRKDEILEFQIGVFEGKLLEFYIFNKAIETDFWKEVEKKHLQGDGGLKISPNWHQSSMYFLTEMILDFMGQNSITHKIADRQQGESQIIESIEKQQKFSLFTKLSFKKEQKWLYEHTLIRKKKSLTFFQAFKQIGGFNSVFYVMEKLNKNCVSVFEDSLHQTLLVELMQIFKSMIKSQIQVCSSQEILKELDSTNHLSIHLKSEDENSSLYPFFYFVHSIQHIYAYISHFLFLTFKKNSFLNNSKSINFLETLFRILMFYSPTLNREIFSNQGIRSSDSERIFHSNERILNLSLKFIKYVLCNFEIWSECSFEIQSYIFVTLEQFIKNQTLTLPLFQYDIHSRILASVVFYYSLQQTHEPKKGNSSSCLLKSKIQLKVLSLCQNLYDKLYYITLTEQFIDKMFKKKTSKRQFNNLVEKYIHRDVNQTLSLIYSLIMSQDRRRVIQNSSKGNDKRVEPQVHTSHSPYFKTIIHLCNYLIKNFIDRKENFSIINDDWTYVLLIVQHLILSNRHLEMLVFSKLLEIAFKIIEKKIKYFNWIIELIDKLIIYPEIGSKSVAIDKEFNIIANIFQKITEIIILNKKFRYDIYESLFYLFEKKMSSITKSLKSQVDSSTELFRQLFLQNYQLRQFLTRKDFDKVLFKMVDIGLTYTLTEFIDFLDLLQKQLSIIESEHGEEKQKGGEEIENSEVRQNIEEVQKNEEMNEAEKDKEKELAVKIQQVTASDKAKTHCPVQAKQNKKVIKEYRRILFEMVYQTAMIDGSNKFWIIDYLKRLTIEQSKNEFQEAKKNTPSKILSNSESNYRLVYFCSINPVLFTFFEKNKNIIFEQEYSEDYQGKIWKVDEDCFFSFLISDSNWSITEIYRIFNNFRVMFEVQSLTGKGKQKSVSEISGREIPYNAYSVHFMNYFIFGRCFHYLLNKYSYSQTLQKVEKPVEASKRLEETCFAFKMLEKVIPILELEKLEKIVIVKSNQKLFSSFSHERISDEWPLSENENKEFGDKTRQKAKQKLKEQLSDFIHIWSQTSESQKSKMKVKSSFSSFSKEGRSIINPSERDIFRELFEKLKFFLLDNSSTKEVKIQKISSYLYKQTHPQNLKWKEIQKIYQNLIKVTELVIRSQRTLTVLKHPEYFNRREIFEENNSRRSFISKPKNAESISSFSNKENRQAYKVTLTQKFNRILESQRQLYSESEKRFTQFEKQNHFWLQLEKGKAEEDHSLFQLDQKQTGTYGHYKLNIKSREVAIEKACYPRRKKIQINVSESIQSNQETNLGKENLGESEVKMTMFTEEQDVQISAKSKVFDFFSMVQETNRPRRNTLLEPKRAVDAVFKKEKVTITQDRENLQCVSKSANETSSSSSSSTFFFCEYVTKKGTYAGKLIVRQEYLQFKYLSHLQMPQQRPYQLSTGKFHQINSLTEEEEKEINEICIPFKRCSLFTRRYILRPTAIELFEKFSHRSYFFNLFYKKKVSKLIELTGTKYNECILDRGSIFEKRKITQSWQTGAISNFEYICLLNKYSGRSTNDLAQYYVMPWVIANYDGSNGYQEVNADFLKQPSNLRNLSHPPGKLDPEKFKKLKDRLMQLDFCEPQERFLYGTMFSNPTVLYNFFIRLQPFIQLHWQHQGNRIDHADRLFSGINEQFKSVLTASSDMKEITPQFYYWPEFLKNRNSIDLGKKQNKQQVNDVILPVWAQTPEEFIFKMRYVLESNEVSAHLHEWIDLTFGFKIKYENAQENDNLYHYNCYEREEDYFEVYSLPEDERQIKSLVVSVSEFGQIPEPLFDKPHPQKNIRDKNLLIDRILPVKSSLNFNSKSKGQTQQNLMSLGFQTCKEGIFIWTDKQVEFKRSYINQNYSFDEENKIFPSKGGKSYCRIMSFDSLSWMTLSDGILRIFNKKTLLFQKIVDSLAIQVVGTYFISSKKSQIYVDKFDPSKQSFSNLSILYGHKQEVFLIQYSKELDVIISIDQQGYVMIHELTNLEFMRSFQLPQEEISDLEKGRYQRKNKVQGNSNENPDYEAKRPCSEEPCLNVMLQIHQMGYFIFLINQKKLVIYTFLDELFLEQDLEISSKTTSMATSSLGKEIITCIRILFHEQSLLLLATNKGSIYMIDFIDCKRYNTTFPYKTYNKITNNILKSAHQWFYCLNQKELKTLLNRKIEKGVSSQLALPIVRFKVEKIMGEKFPLYQILVQYSNGEILCFYEEKYRNFLSICFVYLVGQQLKQNEKLKQLGIF